MCSASPPLWVGGIKAAKMKISQPRWGRYRTTRERFACDILAAKEKGYGRASSLKGSHLPIALMDSPGKRGASSIWASLFPSLRAWQRSKRGKFNFRSHFLQAFKVEKKPLQVALARKLQKPHKLQFCTLGGSRHLFADKEPGDHRIPPLGYQSITRYSASAKSVVADPAHTGRPWSGTGKSEEAGGRLTLRTRSVPL